MNAAERNLRALRDGLKRQFGERIAEPTAPLAELRDLHERLQLADAALQGHSHWRGLLWPVAIIAALLSVAALVPMPRVPFTLEARAGQVRLQMPLAGTLAGQAVDGEWHTEGYTRIESPDTGLATRAATGPLTVRGATQLQALNYPSGTVLLVAAAGRSLRLVAEAPASPLSVALQISGTVDFEAGNDNQRWQTQYRWGEWLRLHYGDARPTDHAPSSVELSLERSDERPLHWRALQPVTVDFTERQVGPGGAPQWPSSLREAHLVLPASGIDTALGAGDRLELAGLELERGELTAGSEVVLRLSGSASTIETQIGTFRRSVKPSLLEWLARHHTLGLLWSAAALLWGAYTWMREQWDAVA